MNRGSCLLLLAEEIVCPPSRPITFYLGSPLTYQGTVKRSPSGSLASRLENFPKKFVSFAVSSQPSLVRPPALPFRLYHACPCHSAVYLSITAVHLVFPEVYHSLLSAAAGSSRLPVPHISLTDKTAAMPSFEETLYVSRQTKHTLQSLLLGNTSEKNNRDWHRSVL